MRKRKLPRHSRAGPLGNVFRQFVAAGIGPSAKARDLELCRNDDPGDKELATRYTAGITDASHNKQRTEQKGAKLDICVTLKALFIFSLGQRPRIFSQMDHER